MENKMLITINGVEREVGINKKIDLASIKDEKIEIKNIIIQNTKSLSALEEVNFTKTGDMREIDLNWLKYCTNLRTLIMQGVCIEVFDTSLLTSDALQIVDLSHNCLSSIDTGVLAGKPLVRLDLSYNKWEIPIDLGSIFQQHPDLSKLRLDLRRVPVSGITVSELGRCELVIAGGIRT
ncbi:MAG: hypothetical protein ACFFCD_03255 [Promethearchaeota archaeon]